MATPAAAAPTPALQTQKNLFSSFTRISRALALLLTSSFLVSYFVPSTTTYLALLPGRTIPFAWNLVTCSFFERNLIYLILDVTATLAICRLVEPVFGTKEFVRFVLVVSSTTALSTFVLIFVVYVFTLTGKLLYTPICGFHGVVAGLLVALKQIMPEQELPIPGAPRVKWLPSLLVLAAVVLALLLPRLLLYIPFLLFGTFNSWIYLRFFQAKEGGLKGDNSDEFAFVTFFPEPLRPFVSPVASIVGGIFCGRRQRAQADSLEGLSGNTPLPGSHPLEASRRRERGAKALEERLAKAADGAGAAGDQPDANADADTSAALVKASEDV